MSSGIGGENPRSVSLLGDNEAIVQALIVGPCDLDVAFVRGLLPMPLGAPIGQQIIAPKRY